MSYELWPWQREAADFCEHRPGSVLEMFMGTGKSLVTIELLKRWRSKRVLILGPLATVDPNAWGGQFSDFYPEASVELLNKGLIPKKSERAKRNLARADRGRVAVNVVNYESAWPIAFSNSALRSANYDTLIVDESHRCKGHTSKTSKFANRMGHRIRSSGGHTLLLTGTFMPHSPLDAFGQMRIIDPNIFGSNFTQFRLRYAVMGGFENRQVVEFKNLDHMRSIIAQYAYQAGREVLNHPLPIESTVWVDLCPEAKRAYKALESDMLAEMEQGTITAANGLVRLLRFQQLTSGEVKTDDGRMIHVDDGKLSAVHEILESTMNEPVVVFGAFTSDVLGTKRISEALGRPAYELSGRLREHDAWQQASLAYRSGGGADRLEAAPVLSAQIKSGGTGINLTGAGLAVYMSTGFNGADFEQSTARLDRPGRQPVVRFIHIVARGTVDEDVRRIGANRKDIVERVLHDLNETRRQMV